MYYFKLFQRFIVISCFLFALPVIVQAQLTLDGELRPRTEFRNGYRALSTADTDPAFFTSQRSRLTLNYQSELYDIRISGQDVRVWGDVVQLQSNANVNIHEAWAQIMISEALDVKLGRQELAYDDHRLLGSVNWTQQARSHDALVLKYHDSSSGLQIDLGGAYNQESENVFGNAYTLNNYKVLSYMWLNKKMGAVNASIIGLTDGFEQSSGSVNFRYTYGTHLMYNKDALKLNGSLYLQNGDDNFRRDISAWMYALKSAYSINSIQLAAGYDYLSGGGVDDSNQPGKAFHTLYATNHKFYGHMDYFLNIPNETRSGGLQDLYLQVSYDVTDQSNISLTYHSFFLAESIADPVNSQTLDKTLGSEFDLNMTHNFTSEIAIKAGYSLLIPSNTLEQMQQVNAEPAQHWGWIMLSLNSRFIHK